METTKKRLEKDLRVQVFGALFLLAALVGSEIVPSLGSTPEPGVSLAFAGALPRPSGLYSLPAAARAALPAPSSIVEAAKAPISLEEFVGLLDKTVEKPTADRIAKSFLKEPALKKAWDEYRDKAGVVPAGEFLQRVARLPEFRQLVNQFKSEPGFQKAFLSLSRNPEVDGALRAMKAAAASGGIGAGSAGLLARSGGAKGADARRSASSLGPRRSVSGMVGAGPSMGPRNSALVASVPSNLRDALGPSALPSAAVAGASAAGSGNGSGGGGGGAWGGPSNAGSGGTTNPKLGPVSTVDKYRDAASFFDSIFATAPKALRDALEYQCFEKDICNPVEACLAAGMYDQCVAACNANAACSGIIPSTPPGTGSGLANIPGAGDGVAVGNGGTVPLLGAVDANGNPITYNITNNYAAGQQCTVPGAAGKGAETGAMIGSAVGGAAGTIAGTMIGQALIPIPGVGAVVGGAVGGAIGAIGGSLIGGAIGGLFD